MPGQVPNASVAFAVRAFRPLFPLPVALLAPAALVAVNVTVYDVLYVETSTEIVPLQLPEALAPPLTEMLQLVVSPPVLTVAVTFRARPLPA